MFSQNTCISEKQKDLKAQLDTIMYLSSYGPLKFTLKSAQNAKFAVNHTLRLNNSNLITDSETVLTLINDMGEMNSKSISRFQVASLN